MRIEDFFALLPHERTKANGETMCRCPAHEDKKSSLSVKAGAKGIILCCHAGCSTADIVAKMGLKMADLFYDPPSESNKKRAANRPVSTGDPAQRIITAPPPKETHEEKTWPDYKAAYGYLGTFECAYVYKDAQGQPLFEVARIRTETDGKIGKTFRQHRLIGAGWTMPLKKGVDDKLKDTIYRLPEVRQAIADGQLIYIVEGEKDCETLASIGLCATTNAMGAEKWRKAHSEWLCGADVVIIPDNDEPGRKHAGHVAAQLRGIAKRVRVLDLAAKYPQLPAKGDVSDYLLMAGAPDGVEALKKWTDEAPEEQEDPRDEAQRIYGDVKGYCVKDGMICKEVGGEHPYAKPLCSFVAIPRAEVTRDNGIDTQTEILLDGWDRDGMALPPVRVPTDAYRNMAWVARYWGLRANIQPGNGVADCLRYAIAEVGYRTSKRLTEYTHSGWRKINGRWGYLYQGGAIGLDSVSVDLGDELSTYTMDVLPEMPMREAATWSYNLLLTLDKKISVPLLAITYLAPLREAMVQSGHAPRFSVFLVGEQQSGKSVSAELALYHFRAVSENQFPASFYDTANRVEDRAFRLKDGLLIVDDLHPASSQQERRKMDEMAQRLSRQTPRGRMNADGSSRKSTPPRCACIMTGEYMPNIGQSGISRCYEIKVEAKDVPKDDGLTEMQKRGQEGVLRLAMRGYIQWLLPQMDELPKKLGERFLDLRAEAFHALGDDGPRMSETVANLMLGYEMMLTYMESLGVVESAADEMAYARRVIVDNARRQTAESKEERPSRLFVSIMSDLLTGRVAAVRDLTDMEVKSDPVKGMCGYKGRDYYYLLPQICYGMVSEQMRKGGVEFPLPAKSLWAQMVTDGLVCPALNGSTSTRVKQIGGESKRLLWIPRRYIDGGEMVEQQALELKAKGFDEVDPDQDDPF